MALSSSIRGISFPFRKGSTSFPESATDEQLIKEDLAQLLLTGVGTRVMRPNFGTNLYSFIFEPNDDLLASLVQAEVATAIAKFEPRISLLDVGVSRVNSEVVVTVNYTLSATGNQDGIDIRFSTP